MKAYWDTSALVLSVSDLALRSRLRAERGFTRPHTLAECFSTLTKGTAGVRVDIEDAFATVENLAADLDWIELTPDEMLAALKQARRRGVRGGRVHDFMHAVAAEKSGAEELLTAHENDFAGLADRPPVKVI